MLCSLEIYKNKKAGSQLCGNIFNCPQPGCKVNNILFSKLAYNRALWNALARSLFCEETLIFH